MKTILQVEDDPNDVLFLQKAMKKMGVANPIQVACDGQEAIDYLQGAGKFADRGKFPFPCLVLLDLKLPYVMGLEVLKWIRNGCGGVAGDHAFGIRARRRHCGFLPSGRQCLCEQALRSAPTRGHCQSNQGLLADA